MTSSAWVPGYATIATRRGAGGGTPSIVAYVTHGVNHANRPNRAIAGCAIHSMRAPTSALSPAGASQTTPFEQNHLVECKTAPVIDREIKQCLGQMIKGVQVIGAHHAGRSRAYTSHWLT